MKHQLLLLVLFSMIFCSPFLRKIEEVTKESCKTLGKEYKTTDKFNCTTGGSSFIVDKQEDCKSGTWTQTAECSATEIATAQCSGTPTFTTTATSESCMLGDEEITTLSTKATCEVALVWNEGKCSKSDIKNENTCTGTQGVWTPSDDAQGSCTTAEGTQTTTKSACDTANGVFSLTETNKGTCSISGKTDKDKCEAATEQWTPGSCSVSQFTPSTKCQGTPKYTKKGECKLGTTTISSRVTKDTCEVELKVKEAGCSNKEVKVAGDCTAAASSVAVKVGECGDIKSNSNFLKAINFALFTICLLF